MPSSAANAILSTMRERRLGSRGLQELIPRTNAQYVLGLLLLLALLLIVALDARSRGHLQTGDSNNLVKGARFALTCLDDREFVACGHAEGSIQTEVFPYPLLQYLPAGFLVALGWNDADVLLALGTLNLLAFAAALLYAAATFRERPRYAALVLLALTGSSLVYHSTSAFGEGLRGSARRHGRLCRRTATSRRDLLVRTRGVTRQGNTRPIHRRTRADLRAIARRRPSSAQTAHGSRDLCGRIGVGRQRSFQRLSLRRRAEPPVPRRTAAHARSVSQSRILLRNPWVAFRRRPLVLALPVGSCARRYSDRNPAFAPPPERTTGLHAPCFA